MRYIIKHFWRHFMARSDTLGGKEIDARLAQYANMFEIILFYVLLTQVASYCNTKMRPITSRSAYRTMNITPRRRILNS